MMIALARTMHHATTDTAEGTRARDKENTTMTKMLRQGDVLLIPIRDIPTSTKVTRDKRGVILAEGEVTGHFHGIKSRSATLYRTEMDERFLRVMGPAPVALAHQEHTTVKIPMGNYQVIIHHEYQPEAIRRVED